MIIFRESRSTRFLGYCVVTCVCVGVRLRGHLKKDTLFQKLAKLGI
jgi:hypothetical protein